MEKGTRINVRALGLILPWVIEHVRSGSIIHNDAALTATDITPGTVAETFLRIIKLTLEKGNEKGTLFILEDVQFLDGQSLEMLTKLIEGLEKLQKVGLLLTFRTELPNSEPFQAVNEVASIVARESKLESEKKVYSEKDRQDLVQALKQKVKKLKFNSFYLELPCLNKSECKNLVARMLDGEPDDASAANIFEATKGDPHFIELTMQWLSEKNMILSSGGNVQIMCDKGSFPKTKEEIIGAKCASLPEEAKRVLHLAASGGEYFDAMYISEVSKKVSLGESKGGGMGIHSVITGLSACADLDLITQVPDHYFTDDEKSKWKFKNDGIYRAAWLQVSAPHRQDIDKNGLEERKKLVLRLKSMNELSDHGSISKS